MKKKEVLEILITTILSISTFIFIFLILRFNNIENFWRLLGCLFTFLFIFFVIILTLIYGKKENKTGKSGFILLIIINLFFTFFINFANYNIFIFEKTINKITKSFETISVSFVSLDEKINLNNLKNERIAIINKTISPNINKLSNEIINELKYSNDTVLYNDFFQMADDMKKGNIKYAILPSNYKTIYNIKEEYLDFSNSLINNYEKKANQEINNEENPKKDINNPFTILIIGVDSISSSYNADTLLLITFNPKTLTATMLSIPRDTYTTLANGAKHKINASGWGGDRSVVYTVSNYLNIKIDYYFKINFTGVVDLVNALNGIDVYVPYSFCEQNSKRQWGRNTVFVKEGWQHLNGEQALALSRNRHGPQSSPAMRIYCPNYNKGIRNDFIRGKNQQLVLKSMLNSVKNINNLDTVYNILDTIGKNISTNMSRKTILSFYNLAKTIIEKTENIELADAIKIQKLFFTSYIQTIRIGNMNLSTVGHYGGSLQIIKQTMYENLGLKEKKTIKTMSFDINNPYHEKIIGEGIYTNKNAPILLENFVGKDISALTNWANKNGFQLKIKEKEINNNSYQNNQIISQSPLEKTDLSTIYNKTINVLIAKVKPFTYDKCLNEEFQNDSRCILKDYTHQTLNTFKDWINKIGITLKIKYIENVGEKEEIVNQNIKNQSIFSIIKDNSTIEITYTKKEVLIPPKEDNKEEPPDITDKENIKPEDNKQENIEENKKEN